MQEAKFYKKLDGQIVACELCHQACLIKNNSVGTCRVRKNIDGKLFSLVYGYPVALNIDPIEKKPLFHFQPGSLSYSLGTLGCNFKCLNCQNWDISQDLNIEQKTADTNLIEPEKIISDALANECLSISYTYNEPTVFTEYALEIMKLARQQNLKNIWVTNGYMSDQCLKTIIPYLDAINVDLKSFDEKFYQKNCGAKLQPVLENLKTIKKSGVHLEITSLVIPGLSDDYEMLKSLAEFITFELGPDVPWHISKFSPAISWKLKKTSSTSEEAIFEACDIGKNTGLKYIYAGNIPGDQRENTYCPACGELAIRRFGYEIARLDHHGRCASCDKNLDIFE
ncbi:MAG: AmmeMemoRadiSam system radical SAM enzyme [bacterium]|nr:AmmeMemoRadiSam system radical SAM enzyme [bacterium]